MNVQQQFESLFGPEFGHGKSFELARLHIALAALGAPHQHLVPVIHVAGTNGKGSTIAFIRAIAEAAGLHVHAFTKPHLLQLNERFCVAGKNADDDALIAAVERVARIARDLTQFEAHVACAYLLFSETRADLCLIETGMGGRDDATNVLTNPAACVLTPIALDHQDVLGTTLAEIAAHKAGILKPGVPAIIARQNAEARSVIEARAAEISAPVFRQGVEWDAFASGGRMVVQSETRALDLPLPALAGAHQIDNAVLAVATLLYSDIAQISDDAFEIGIARAHWPGRLQLLARGPFSAPIRAGGGEVWVDGAHNAHAASALTRWAAAMQAKRRAPLVVIFGALERKHWASMLQVLAPVADLVIATPLTEGGVPASKITDAARAEGGNAEIASSLSDATEKATRFPAPRVLICGSLLLAAEALALSRV